MLVEVLSRLTENQTETAFFSKNRNRLGLKKPEITENRPKIAENSSAFLSKFVESLKSGMNVSTDYSCSSHRPSSIINPDSAFDQLIFIPLT